MRWPWQWRRQVAKPMNHVDPQPDGNRVLRPREPRWADLLGDPVHRALTEATQPLPTLAPLLTVGQRWRTTGVAR